MPSQLPSVWCHKITWSMARSFRLPRQSAGNARRALLAACGAALIVTPIPSAGPKGERLAVIRPWGSSVLSLSLCEPRPRQVFMNGKPASPDIAEDPDEFLDALENAGAFKGQEEVLLRLRELAAAGVHPLEVLSLQRQVPQEEALPKCLQSFDIEGIAQYILQHQCRNVVVLCGAGISTSAGIPDFRTPGTGLYDNLKEFNLSRPELIFDLNFFKENPGAFYALCKDMWPGNYEPTPTHYFIRLLNDKGILKRCYSQNIDSLERQAGLPASRLVAAHGNFDEAHVIDTYPEVKIDVQELKSALDKGEKGWQELRNQTGNLVKPKIVFFGEELPERFYQLHAKDLEECDALIVLGTSLVVQPFASLVSCASRRAPRLLINREPAGTNETLQFGFRFHLKEGGDNWRDVWHKGECDAGCRALAAALGWESELEALVSSRGSASTNKAPWVFRDLV